MRQYICDIPTMESSGAIVLSISHAVKRGTEYRVQVLAKHGITDIRPDGWYSTQSLLNAIKEIGENIGDLNMLAMGRDFVLRHELPPLPNLREGLELLSVMHLHNNRIGGKLLAELSADQLPSDIGQFHLAEYDEKARRAVAYTTSPFSAKNLEGCIAGILERFRPKDSTQYSIQEDITKERHTQGGNSTTYLITW